MQKDAGARGGVVVVGGGGAQHQHRSEEQHCVRGEEPDPLKRRAGRDPPTFGDVMQELGIKHALLLAEREVHLSTKTRSYWLEERSILS